jgi:DNA-binding transcriptional ArsR family regulator
VDRVDLRRLSKGLFGNSYRVEIAGAIATAPTDLLHAHELAAELGIPHNLVSKQLKDFVAAGILDDVAQVQGQRYRYFRRLDSPYWAVCRDLLRELRVEEATSSSG